MNRSSNEQHLFEVQIFYNINVFTVTFDQFIASSLNNSILFIIRKSC